MTAHADLLRLFADWRRFQPPTLVDGVPDYAAAAMAAQQRELARYQRRLAAIDPARLADPAAGGLPHRPRGDERARLRSPRAAAVGEQPGVLRHGLRGRERSAGARGAATRAGAVELWSYAFPLDRGARRRVDAALRAIPALLEQARANLVGNGPRPVDVRRTATCAQQSADARAVSRRGSPTRPGDLRAGRRAREGGDRRVRRVARRAGRRRRPGRPASASRTTTGT